MDEFDEKPVNPAFQKGFNNGYLLQKHEPKMMDSLLKGVDGKELPYLEGLKFGSAEFKKELFRERLSSNDNSQKDQNRENDFGLEHERK